METYIIEHCIIDVENDGKKPGDTVNVSVTIDTNFYKKSAYKSVYCLTWFIGDEPVDLARRAFAHYKLGTQPDKRQRIEPATPEKVSSEQIRANIKVNEGTFEQAMGTLRAILDEPEPRRPYYLERLISALNLCSDVAKHRAKLELELQLAVQSGK